MENQQIYCKPVILSFTLLIPKAKKLASQTGAKMRLNSDKESFGGHLIACQGTTGTLGFLLHLCQGPHLPVWGWLTTDEETAAVSAGCAE